MQFDSFRVELDEQTRVVSFGLMLDGKVSTFAIQNAHSLSHPSKDSWHICTVEITNVGGEMVQKVTRAPRNFNLVKLSHCSTCHDNKNVDFQNAIIKHANGQYTENAEFYRDLSRILDRQMLQIARCQSCQYGPVCMNCGTDYSVAAAGG